MRWSGPSYSGNQRQSPPYLRPVAVVILAATLGGCAGLGMPFNEAGSRQTALTGSIQKVSARASKVDQSDWQAVRRAVAGAVSKKTSHGTVEWSNPDTGSTGTITILDTVTATNDPNCRNFATTVNDMRGIRRYRGEACQMSNGRWRLFRVLADDSQLL